jgi:serine/threonine-protein kinase
VPDLYLLTRAYLKEVRAMSFADLQARQEPPWSNVPFGGSGIAWALWRSRALPRAIRIRNADAWLAAAARTARQRLAFHHREHRGSLEWSLYYAADGIALVQLLIAHDRRSRIPGGKASRGTDQSRRGFEDRLSRFLARCRRKRGGPSELLQGTAGYLAATTLLYRLTGEPRALAVADGLARDLLERGEAAGGWIRAPRLGLGHGRAGTLFALLGWSMAAERALPRWLFDGLARLADDVAREGRLGAPAQLTAPVMQRSWCNGAAGLVLLWVRAHEHSGAPEHLEHARTMAHHLGEYTWATGNLCCGLGGRAYALLAVDRIDPDRGWFDGAQRLAAQAGEMMIAAPGGWPNGLYHGFPGLVCLAEDLARPRGARVGFPLVEG